MPETEPGSLRRALSSAKNLPERRLCGAFGSVGLAALSGGSSLGGRAEELRGRSVLIAVNDQLAAALALIELDGVARRLILCPPELSAAHLPSIIAAGEVDALVGDASGSDTGGAGVRPSIPCTATLAPCRHERGAGVATEWVLLTSGTTGAPKLVVHTLASLTGAMTGRKALGGGAVWSTFYDIRRYGGLQIFLRAMLGGGSMVLSSAAEPTADFLSRVGERGVTHISGTPSHWRRALMSPAARQIRPRYVRLSGEIADQAILDHLRSAYGDADVAHAFASTEAGLAFEVGDGLAGFPASLVGQPGGAVELRVCDGSLHIKSGRTALRYLGDAAKPLRGADEFVDTGDVVERRDGRFYFAGRRDGVINVGGLKVHPEEVEAVINRHPGVRMSLVRTRKSPIVGAIVVADVVIAEASRGDRTTAREQVLEREILLACRSALDRHKVPATIRFVPALAVAPSGKLVRPHA
jgi:acyl-coenzyme A synthetase/AMP-(fatty) acid ligase